MGTIPLSRSLHLDYMVSAPAPQSLINHNSTTFSSLEINKTTHNHETYIMAGTTQATHLLYHWHFILKELCKKFEHTRDILYNNTISCWYPIAHFIPQDPSSITFFDSSSNTIGGYSDTLQFWCYFHCPPKILTRVVKAKTNTTIRNHVTEPLALLLNHMAVTTASLKWPNTDDSFPPLQLFTNTIAFKA